MGKGVEHIHHAARLLARVSCRSPETRAVAIGELDSSPHCVEHAARLGREHGVDLLLFHALQQSDQLSLLPAPLRLELAARFEHATQASAAQFEDLCELLDAFQQAGVRGALLKEYAHDGTFASGCIRQGDIDILVAPAQLRDAAALLDNRGYARVPRPWDDEYRYKREGHATVDLQYSFDPHVGRWADVPMDIDSLLQRARPLSGAPTAVSVLDPLDNVVFLLLHTTLHHDLRPFVKVASCWNYMVRKQDEVAFPAVHARLQELGWQPLYWYVFEAVRALCGYRFPRYESAPRPNAWERALFRGSATRLRSLFDAPKRRPGRRPRRMSWYWCVYPRTARRKAACLAAVAREHVETPGGVA